MLKKIAIFCGGPSSEHEVSLSSASAIYESINKKKYELYFFYISREKKCRLVIASDEVDLTKIKADRDLLHGLEDLSRKKIFALLAGIHGEFVEDGKLQVMLEYFNIPYTGSKIASSSLCMDKYRSMLIAGEIPGIHLPKTIHIDKGSSIPRTSFPCIVKPNSLGSSVGVFKVNNNEELRKAVDTIFTKYEEELVIIQEFIDGIELSCGVLQDKKGKIIQLPPIEIRPVNSPVFDYSSKYEVGGSEEITPPQSLSKKESDRISEISERVHLLLGCKLYSRSDFRVRRGKIYYFETNTLPGLTATSLIPQEANAIGISFPKLLDFLIDNS